MDSARRHRASTNSTIPTGTLIQKIDCHDHPLVTAPPTSGPAATATPPMAPHTPSAWFLRSGRTAAESKVSDSGMMSAPPAPCTARAVTSQPTVGDSAAAAEAPVKMTRPARNIRRRPKRSPRAAPVSNSTAKVSV